MDDPLPPQVHEVSHADRSESTALRGVFAALECSIRSDSNAARSRLALMGGP